MNTPWHCADKQQLSLNEHATSDGCTWPLKGCNTELNRTDTMMALLMPVVSTSRAILISYAFSALTEHQFSNFQRESMSALDSQ
jgi:hypothetical protein